MGCVRSAHAADVAKEIAMGIWVAVTGGVMVGFCLGTLLTSLLHIAKRADTETELSTGMLHPVRVVGKTMG